MQIIRFKSDDNKIYTGCDFDNNSALLQTKFLQLPDCVAHDFSCLFSSSRFLKPNPFVQF